MLFISSNTNKVLLLACILLCYTSVSAQDGITKAGDGNPTQSNLMVYLLVGVALLLAFAIYALGQVMITLSRHIVDKNKKIPKPVIPFIGLGLLLLSQNGFSQGTAASVEALPNYGGLSATAFYLLFSVIAIEIIAIFFMAYAINGLYKALQPEKEVLQHVKKESAFVKWWSRFDKKVLTRAIPLEKEADLMLDHDYDGIKELDNALPPWWKYGFYLTIVVAFIYLLNFHVFGTGKNPAEEYAEEMQRAQIEKEIYEANNKDKIDENNVPMADASGLARAKEIFTTKCFACHGKAGEGGAGPNLADDYWLHKGSLNDIYYTIKNGYPEKGMQSWAGEYTPKEISFLASYVRTLHGTNPPNAKAPQGDIDPAANTPVKQDSAKTVSGGGSQVTLIDTVSKKQ